MKSYVIGPHDELIKMYEKLMCSFGYMLKKFEPLTASYRVNNQVIPVDSKYRMFYVHYGKILITCAIIITPTEEVFITYVDGNTTEKKVVKIRSYTSVRQVINILKLKGSVE